MSQSPLLKTEVIEVDGQSITVFELSGLGNVEYFEYLHDLDVPEELPAEPTAKQVNKCNLAWKRYAFSAQSRLAALALLPGEDNYLSLNINDYQQQVQRTYTQEVIREIHNKCAELSGIELTTQNDAEEEPETSEKKT